MIIDLILSCIGTLFICYSTLLFVEFLGEMNGRK